MKKSGDRIDNIYEILNRIDKKLIHLEFSVEYNHGQILILKDQIEAVMRMMNVINSSVEELKVLVFDLPYYDNDDDPRG